MPGIVIATFGTLYGRNMRTGSIPKIPTGITIVPVPILMIGMVFWVFGTSVWCKNWSYASLSDFVIKIGPKGLSYCLYWRAAAIVSPGNRMFFSCINDCIDHYVSIWLLWCKMPEQQTSWTCCRKKVYQKKVKMVSQRLIRKLSLTQGKFNTRGGGKQ